MDLINFTNAVLETSLEPRTLAALAAGLAIGLGALGSAIAMGNAASHAFEAGARQPEIFGKIQTLLLIAIAFIESVCIYSLVIALILIFAVK